ncbi:MAG: zinc-dependent peptidase [Lacibacter sp.]
MPQDTVPVLITFGDTSFLITSMEEYNRLPDSLRQPEVLEQIQYYYAQNKQQEAEDYPVLPFLFVFIMMFLFWKLIRSAKQEMNESTADEIITKQPNSCLTYNGAELYFAAREIESVCLKYNPYFKNLSPEKQSVFIERVQQFIRNKVFYIHSSIGYKEMPILISAAAIQITFGLEEYLLPHFSNIIVHEEEYFGLNPLRVLVGNVQGNSISLSWKHFLEDYQNPTDGKNVGLHEMAHALQVQFLFQNSWKRSEFKEDFDHYDRIDDEILNTEKISPSKLFNENALSNKNEFWATSVELFFEKPEALKQFYPKLYSGISAVLNQHTIPS